MRSILLLIFLPVYLFGQTCSNPAGNETTYGTNNVWIGYVYDNMDFTKYHGYITEGSPVAPTFDESFGGDYDSIRPVGGCPVYTETFSVRFKLQQVFADGDYEIIVGGDDGFRLSVDGGNTWVINEWNEHGFLSKNTTVHLSGSTNLVLEYYEKDVINHVTFEMHAVCNISGPQNVYGSNNQWIGYVYNDTSHTGYRGTIGEGTPSNPNFYEDYGTTEGFGRTTQCFFIAESFSVKFLLRKQFTAGNYHFTVGGDDGYRLSFDGGNTWPIDNYGLHSYVTSEKTISLNGTYDMVLEYFDINGDNIVSFELQQGALPIHITSFNASQKTRYQNQLTWTALAIESGTSFIIERSNNGSAFEAIGSMQVNVAANEQSFSFVDDKVPAGNNFYRIKMIDRSGQTISAVRMVSTGSNGKLIVFPNPVKDGIVHFNAPGKALQVQLLDYSGRLIMQRSFAQLGEGQMIELHLPTAIAKGYYILYCKDQSGRSFQQRITVE